MQKCPKCGTILDDSKKQCYMCGTMLKEDNSSSFAEALGLIEAPQKNATNKNESKPAPAPNEFSDSNINFFSEELNRLNSIEIKNLEIDSSKIKNAQTKQKEQNKEPKKETKKNNNKKKKEPTVQNNIPKNGTFFSQDNSSYSGNQPAPKNEKKQTQFNKPKLKIKANQVFNFACVIVFVIVVIVAAKHFFQPKETKNNLGGLIFKVDKRFELSSSDGSNRYYKYQDNCSIRLMYGASSGGDDFIDNYLESQKAEFEKQENTSTMTEELLINGNSWKALSIVNFVPQNDSDEYDPFLKYKYVSIFHNGNFYHTVFVNADNDITCREMYDEFTSTLTFE